MKRTATITLIAASCSILSPTLYANNMSGDTYYQQCLLSAIAKADAATPVGELTERCKRKRNERLQVSVDQNIVNESTGNSTSSNTVGDVPQDKKKGIIAKRLESERKRQFERFVITPHRRTFIQPVLTTNNVNTEAYQAIDGYGEELKDVETKFQLSLKVPLNSEPLFFENDALYVGFTLQAWWQVYSENTSRPFRETNYQPEIFYIAPTPISFFGGNTSVVVGFEHQSNGRTQLLSRSWNRLYTNFIWEDENLALSFRPWYRIPEDDKSFALDPDGDDNPDIDEFLGHFELGGAYTWNDYELSLMTRRSFETANGSLEMGFSFPLFGRLRGYATAFTGYGESLIDYNHKQTRFGIGVTLNDMLFGD